MRSAQSSSAKARCGRGYRCRQGVLQRHVGVAGTAEGETGFELPSTKTLVTGKLDTEVYPRGRVRSKPDSSPKMFVDVLSSLVGIMFHRTLSETTSSLSQSVGLVAVCTESPCRSIWWFVQVLSGTTQVYQQPLFSGYHRLWLPLLSGYSWFSSSFTDLTSTAIVSDSTSSSGGVWVAFTGTPTSGYFGSYTGSSSRDSSPPSSLTTCLSQPACQRNIISVRMATAAFGSARR